MSSDWRDTTTMQIKMGRRKQLDVLRMVMSAQQGEMLDLREVLDQVLEAGISALSDQPIIILSPEPPMGGNGAETGCGDG